MKKEDKDMEIHFENGHVPRRQNQNSNISHTAARGIDVYKRQEISNIVEAFCGRTEKAGYFVSVYANLWWLNNKISDRVTERYDIWLAQWADAPSYGGKYGMWQYTSSGKTDGITGNTDMDLSLIHI